MKTISIPNPNDSWAQVELFRWQYGVLPAPKDFRPLNVAEGLRKMADAIQAAKTTGATAEEQQNIPAPFNVFSVMTYAANLLDFTPGRETDAANLRKIAHAIQEGCMRDASTEAKKNMPSPFEVCLALRFVASILGEQSPAQSRVEPPTPRDKITSGRNWPCPCGSGKKFKKCCLLNRGKQS